MSCQERDRQSLSGFSIPIFTRIVGKNIGRNQRLSQKGNDLEIQNLLNDSAGKAERPTMRTNNGVSFRFSKRDINLSYNDAFVNVNKNIDGLPRLGM